MDKEKSKIIVKDGHLWQDGVKLKLEFGNLEQIEAIKKANKKMEAFISGEVEPNCSYEIRGTAGFFCMCEKFLTVSNIEAESEDDVTCFEDEIVTCRVCNKKYQFIIEREYKVYGTKSICTSEDLKVKLI